MTKNKDLEISNGVLDKIDFTNTYIRSIADLFLRSIITADEFNVAIEAICIQKQGLLAQSLLT